MSNNQLMIVQRELDLLKKHLEVSDLSEYNKRKLRAELETAQIVSESELPDDVVCIDSVVEIEEEESGRRYTFQLVLPSEANMKKNKVSVFAPIGVALLGYRTGTMVQWEMPNGLKSFRILKAAKSQENELAEALLNEK